MKCGAPLHHRRNAISNFGVIVFCCCLSATMQPAVACSSRVKVPIPRMLPSSQFLFPTVADRMDHWSNPITMTEGDSLFLLVRDGTVVGLDGDTIMTALDPVKKADSSPSKDLSSTFSQSGYSWKRLVAIKDGSGHINIASGDQKKTLIVTVKPLGPAFRYVQSEPPKPISVSASNATREHPRGIYEHSLFEITLPGELKDGWSANDPEESGAALYMVEQLSAPQGSAQPFVKLSLTMKAHYGNGKGPYHLVIRHGGALSSGETYDFYLMVPPTPIC